MNAALWNQSVFSKKCDVLNRGYLYSDGAFSKSGHSAEIKLLEKFWQGFVFCLKFKTLKASFYFSNHLPKRKGVVRLQFSLSVYSCLNDFLSEAGRQFIFGQDKEFATGSTTKNKSRF